MAATPGSPVTDTDLGPWLFRLAITAVTFLIGWGLKDVKRRYDRVPELELILTRLEEQLKEVDRRLNVLERQS